MSFEFSATELGFTDGLGGASNSAAEGEYHYILFGRQMDSQDPETLATYFEFDDQINGGINLVERITIAENEVTFSLTNSETIRVIRQTDDSSWQQFLRGIAESFAPERILG